jgi:hypothetical protein
LNSVVIPFRKIIGQNGAEWILILLLAALVFLFLFVLI